MNDDNPFKAPLARVHDYHESEPATFLPNGRRVPTGNGYQWLLRAWQIFRASPGTWMGITIAFVLSIMVVSAIPILNLAANLLIPVFVGGICIGCRAIEDGEELRFLHLFSGFSQRLGSLLLVGLLYSVAVLVAVAVIAVTAALGAGGGQTKVGSVAFILISLLVLLVLLPVLLALWLAPPLVIFHDFSAWRAIRTSISVSLRNSLPFLAYGLLVLIAAVVASLPLFLGWLVLLPMLYASGYVFYRDVFFAE